MDEKFAADKILPEFDRMIEDRKLPYWSEFRATFFLSFIFLSIKSCFDAGQSKSTPHAAWA